MDILSQSNAAGGLLAGEQGTAQQEMDRWQMVRQQACQRFPYTREEATTHEQERWCDIFEQLTGELLRQYGLEDPAILNEEAWTTIAFGCLSPMASAMLKEIEAEEQAAMAREAREIEARIQQREATKRQLKPGQEVAIWVNQGDRPATVLAVVGQQALLEYRMPRGSTALRIVRADQAQVLIRKVSYQQVPLAFLREMRATGREWIGEPQAGHPAGTVEMCFRLRTRRKLPVETPNMLPLPWVETDRHTTPAQSAEAGEDSDTFE